ncbi:hypothetical protein EON81_03025 [bacterium]|nr:MAG: hypothetical protein EON81_03025 [bacterium]
MKERILREALRLIRTGKDDGVTEIMTPWKYTASGRFFDGQATDGATYVWVSVDPERVKVCLTCDEDDAGRLIEVGMIYQAHTKEYGLVLSAYAKRAPFAVVVQPEVLKA